MRLITQESEETLPKLYDTEGVKLDEKIIHIRFYEPSSGWEWLLTEYEPESKTAFGYVKGFEGEWGYFSLLEMEDIPTIKRDESFKPTRFKDLEAYDESK